MTSLKSSQQKTCQFLRIFVHCRFYILELHLGGTSRFFVISVSIQVISLRGGWWYLSTFKSIRNVDAMLLGGFPVTSTEFPNRADGLVSFLKYGKLEMTEENHRKSRAQHYPNWKNFTVETWQASDRRRNWDPIDEMYPMMATSSDTCEVLRMTSVTVNFCNTVGMVLGLLGGGTIFSISSRSLIILWRRRSNSGNWEHQHGYEHYQSDTTQNSHCPLLS